MKLWVRGVSGFKRRVGERERKGEMECGGEKKILGKGWGEL